MKYRNSLIKGFLIVLILFLHLELFALQKQKITENDYSNQNVEMADHLRAEGKIYVVIAVILILFAGIIFYMVLIDRKLNKIEKELKA